LFALVSEASLPSGDFSVTSLEDFESLVFESLFFREPKEEVFFRKELGIAQGFVFEP
jgi:hypothetical protein